MKLDLKNFGGPKKRGKKKTLKKRGELINPLRDWSVGLAVAAAIFCLGIGVTAFDFYSQFYVTTDVEVGEKPLVYRGNEVEMYSEIYEKKEQEFDRLRSQIVVIPVQELPTETTSDEEALAEEAVDG